MTFSIVLLLLLCAPTIFLTELQSFLSNTDALLEWFFSLHLLIAAVLLLRWLLKERISCRVRYALWSVVLVRALLPIQLSLPLPVSSADLAPVLPAVLEQPVLVFSNPLPGPQPVPDPLPDADRVTPPAALPQETRQNSLSPEDLLLMLWKGGSVTALLFLAGSNAVFDLRLIRRRKTLELPDLPIPVYTVEGLASPCLFGPFHPTIYLTPESSADETTRRHVLAHELTHYAHKDHLWSLLRCLCLVIHWYSPLIWAAVILSKRDCELACDEGAVKRLGEGERIPYGRTLVDLVARKSRSTLFSCSTTMTDGPKTIRRRVERLVKQPESKKTALFLAMSLLAVAAVFTFAGDEPTAEELNLPTAEEGYAHFTEYLNNEFPLQVQKPIPEMDKGLPYLTDPDLITAAKGILRKNTTPLIEVGENIPFTQFIDTAHHLTLYYSVDDRVYAQDYCTAETDGVSYLFLRKSDVNERDTLIPIARLEEGALESLLSLAAEQLELDAAFWRDPALGYRQLMEALESTEGAGVYTTQHGVYAGTDSVNYPDLTELVIALLSEAKPLSAPVPDLERVSGDRITLFDALSRSSPAGWNVREYYLAQQSGTNYLTLHHDGLYTPIALLPADCAAALSTLIDDPKTDGAQLEIELFKQNLGGLFYIFMYDEKVDKTTSSLYLTVSEQEELNTIKLILAASCMPWEEGTEIPQTLSPTYILLDTDNRTTPAPEYVIEAFDSFNILYRVGERRTPIATIPDEAITQIRTLADPDYNPRVVMGISILGSGNTRYETDDPATIAQLARLLVNDPTAVEQNYHPRYDMTDWLTNQTIHISVQYGSKLWSRDQTEIWYLRAITDNRSFYCVDIPEHLVADVKAICERMDNYLTYAISFDHARFAHYTPSPHSNLYISEISQEMLTEIDALLDNAALANDTEVLSVPESDGILDFRLPLETEKIYLFLQEDGDRCLASAVRKIESGAMEHPVTHILPAGTSKALRAIVDPTFGVKTEYRIDDRARITQLSELFLSDPETVLLNESPDYDLADWLTNWTNGYHIYYGTDYCPPGSEADWYARAIDAGSWYFIRIPAHLVDEVLSICNQPS